MLEEPIKVERGFVKALEKPGLGVEINGKMFEENVIKWIENDFYTSTLIDVWYFLLLNGLQVS